MNEKDVVKEIEEVLKKHNCYFKVEHTIQILPKPIMPEIKEDKKK